MKIRIPGTGIEAEVVSDEETEKASMTICVRVADMPVGHFAGDLFATCSVCGALVRHRPYAPKAPPKVCMQCAAGLIERGVQ